MTNPAPLCLLHGLMGSGAEWAAVAKAIPGGCLTPDLLGHSQAPALTQGAVWPQYLAQLDDLIPQGAILAGHSMGGILALRYGAERPERIKRVVLLEAGVQPSSPQSLAALSRWITEDWPERFASDRAARSFLARCGLHPDWVVNLKADLSPGFDPRSCAKAITELDGLSRMPVLNRLRCPLHLILAEHSLLEPSDIATMRQHPACHAPVVIDAAGHDLHLDQPAAVANALSAIR